MMLKQNLLIKSNQLMDQLSTRHTHPMLDCSIRTPPHTQLQLFHSVLQFTDCVCAGQDRSDETWPMNANTRPASQPADSHSFNLSNNAFQKFHPCRSLSSMSPISRRDFATCLGNLKRSIKSTDPLVSLLRKEIHFGSHYGWVHRWFFSIDLCSSHFFHHLRDTFCMLNSLYATI